MKALRLIPPEPGRGLVLAEGRDALWINSHRSPRLVELASTDGIIVIPEDECSSGTLHLIGSIGPYVDVELCTGIMMVRPEPYRLSVELARGQANKLRNKVAQWESDGWNIPPDWLPRVRCLASELCQAIQSCGLNGDEAALRSLESALTLGDQLTESHALHQLGRDDDSAAMPLLAYQSTRPDMVVDGSPLPSGLEAWVIPLDWNRLNTGDNEFDWSHLDRCVEVSIARGVTPILGPILDFREDRFPRWLLKWTSAPETLMTLMVDLVETVVGRYSGRVFHWIVTGGANSSTMLELGQQQLEYVTARILGAARSVDRNGSMVVRVDDPWGWYAGRPTRREWPVDFVDSLSRAGIPPCALALDLRAGRGPRRTALDHYKLLDRYRRLEIPLWPMIDGPPRTSSNEPSSGQTQRIHAVMAHPMCERVIICESTDPADGARMQARATEDPTLSLLEQLLGGPR